MARAVSPRRFRTSRAARGRFARLLLALSAAGVFYAWWRFAPAALGTPHLTAYTKNHLARELLFGAAAATYVIYLCAVARNVRDYWALQAFSALIAAVFWIGLFAGYGLDGLDQIWRGAVSARDAYTFHIPQTVTWFFGALLLPRPVEERRL